MREEVEKKLEEWKKEIGEIPPNTCPDIDNLIKAHQKILEDLAYLEKNAHKYENAEELAKDFPSTWNDDVESLAEDLRKDNEQLRELGKFWYEKTKEVLEELENLKEWNKVHGFTI